MKTLAARRMHARRGEMEPRPALVRRIYINDIDFQLEITTAADRPTLRMRAGRALFENSNFERKLAICSFDVICSIRTKNMRMHGHCIYLYVYLICI